MVSKDKSNEQLNLRISPILLKDITLLSQTLNVNKSEWIKTKLGELVYEEKAKLLDRYAELANKGIIDKKELERMSKLFHQ